VVGYKGSGKHMEENERLYPISEELFNEKVLLTIEKNYI
jgi:hypothetical protein